MQQTLSLYQELSQEYIPNHLNRLMALLSDGLEHSTEEVIKVAGKQYNARIYELRKLGFNIISMRSIGIFGFALKSEKVDIPKPTHTYNKYTHII